MQTNGLTQVLMEEQLILIVIILQNTLQMVLMEMQIAQIMFLSVCMQAE